MQINLSPINFTNPDSAYMGVSSNRSFLYRQAVVKEDKLFMLLSIKPLPLLNIFLSTAARPRTTFKIVGKEKGKQKEQSLFIPQTPRNLSVLSSPPFTSTVKILPP